MWKITFFYSMYNVTWTETFYMSGSTSFASMQNAAIAVGIARLGMLAPQVTWVATRAVLTTQPRSAIFLGTNNSPTTGTFVYTPGTDPDQDAAPAFVAVQVKLFGQSTRTYRRYFAGAPEGIVSTKFTGRNLGALGLWRNALANFVLSLFTNSFALRFQNQAAKQNCTGVTTAAQFPNEIGVSFNQQMIAQVAGQTNYLLLRGFRSVNPKLFGIGGVYPVDPASPGLTAVASPFTYYLQNSSRIAPANIAKTGYGVQLTYGFDQISLANSPDGGGFSILSVNHRKRGGSALSLRGRLRTKP